MSNNRYSVTRDEPCYEGTWFGYYDCKKEEIVFKATGGRDGLKQVTRSSYTPQDYHFAFYDKRVQTLVFHRNKQSTPKYLIKQ